MQRERRERKSEGRGWVRWEGRGVNFDMSFLKLSFDNWQFVQLVKCQESKKIDEVHNRCLRLTLRCGLESHARIRPPKRYRNEISQTHTHKHIRTVGCWRAPLIWKTGPRQFSRARFLPEHESVIQMMAATDWGLVDLLGRLSCCNGLCCDINETTLR